MWVGVRFDGSILDDDFYSWVEFKRLLPSSIINEDGDYIIDNSDLEVFWNGDEVCGFGIGVFHHDWDDRVEEFDPDKIVELAKSAREKMKEHMKDWGLRHEVKLWCQADFS